jgi:hypothetical protein
MNRALDKPGCDETIFPQLYVTAQTGKEPSCPHLNTLESSPDARAALCAERVAAALRAAPNITYTAAQCRRCELWCQQSAKQACHDKCYKYRC